MKRRFVVPTAVALALHAILLFGFRPAHPPIVVGFDPRVVKPSPPPEKPIEVVWPPASEDPPAPTPKGEPAVSRPEILEPPAREPTTEISMLPSIRNLNPIDVTNRLPIGPIGIHDGEEGWLGDSTPALPTGPQLDHPPSPRSQIAPIYPYEARKDGRRGEVLVEFVVDEAGRVISPHVLRSNDRLFEAPTLRAVAKWRFEPGRHHGRVVRCRMAVPVEFTVNPETGR